MDGMDNVRFQSGNVKEKKSTQKKENETEKEMPMVLRNLKNGS